MHAHSRKANIARELPEFVRDHFDDFGKRPTYREIAAAFDCSLGTVQAAIVICRKRDGDPSADPAVSGVSQPIAYTR